MANVHKGDVTLRAGERSYTLRFSIDALCVLEDACGGKGIVALSAELSDPSTLRLGLLRKVLWAGLRDHHPEIDEKAAGEIIPEAGGLAVVMAAVNTAFELAFPPADAKPNGDARPPVPGQDGTGPASAEPGAR